MRRRYARQSHQRLGETMVAPMSKVRRRPRDCMTAFPRAAAGSKLPSFSPFSPS
ncbi:MAG: hypothetical protein MZW92_75950 [Comamonadaceae bacterium]|nr:hypothetical protein [Comamonadaceae bacterium]